MARVPTSLVRNWRLKLSALGLSVFLWALVQTEPLSEETFSSVPVRIEVADTAWTVAGPPVPETVELRLGGPAREIIRLAREGASVVVPIASVGSRDTIIALQRDWVQLGQRPGLTVESISPVTLQVSFEQAVSRTIPVALTVEGVLSTDLALSSELRISPESVLVRGPEGRLERLDSIPLRPLDLRRVGESDIFTLAVDTTGLAIASVVPTEVMVAVRVEPMLVRVMDDVVIEPDVRAAGVTVVVEPPSVRLRLSGARTLVTAMDLTLLRVSVSADDLRGITDGEERLARLQVEGVPALVTAQPSTEIVTVRRAADPSGRTQPGPS